MLPAVAGMLLLFAVSFPAYRVATDGLGLFAAAGIRFVVALAVLLPLAWRSWPRDRLLSRRHLLLGACLMAPNVLTVMAAIEADSASLAALILGLEPVTITLVALALAGERPRRATWVALGVGFVGIAVVSGALTTSPGSLPVRAVVLLLGTVATFSVYTVLVRRHSEGVGAPAVAALSHIGALAVLAPLALIDVARGMAVRPAADAGTVVAIVYAGAGTAVAYLLFSYAVARRPSARFAVSLYAVPPLGVLAAFVMLKERPHARDILGGALILTAVWLGERAR